MLETVENARSAEPRETQLVPQPPVHAVTHESACIERPSRALGYARQHAVPWLRDTAVIQVLPAGVLSVSIFEGHIEPALLPVALEVLPEVRQLQRGAQRIRRRIQPRVVVPRDPQDEPAHRIGRTAAIVEEGRPRVIAMRRDILTKRAEQIVEKRQR